MPDSKSVLRRFTVGDVLSAAGALLLAMRLAAPLGFPERDLVRVAIVATLVGVADAVLSEWLNAAVRASWVYAHSMPVVPIEDGRVRE